MEPRKEVPWPTGVILAILAGLGAGMVVECRLGVVELERAAVRVPADEPSELSSKSSAVPVEPSLLR